MNATLGQQYLLASKARGKLERCAQCGKNKDYYLRVLVGHANLLDRLLSGIDKYRGKAAQRAEECSVEYISSEDDFDEQCREFPSSSSASDSSSSDYESDEEDESDEALRYTPLSLCGNQGQPPVVAIASDQLCDDYESDSESDVEHQTMAPLEFHCEPIHA